MYSGVPLTKEIPMPDNPTNLASVTQELRRLKCREQELLLADLSSDACHNAWLEANSELFCALMNHLDTLLDAASRSLEGGEASDDPTKPAPGDDLRYEANSLREILDENRQQNRELKKQVAENTKECERLREDYRKLSFEVRDDVAMYLCKEPEKYAEHLDLPPDERDAELERLRGLVRESRAAHLQLKCDSFPMSEQECDDWNAATNAMLTPLSSLETARQAGGGE